MSERSGARERSKQGGARSTSKWCERTSKRMSEWPSTYVSILVCYRPECDGDEDDDAIGAYFATTQHSDETLQLSFVLLR